jgi:hypothetical protein
MVYTSDLLFPVSEMMARYTARETQKGYEPCIFFVCFERLSSFILRHCSQGLSLPVHLFSLIVALQVTNVWKAILHNQEKQSAVIDVHSWLSRASLDIIGAAAFSYDFNALEGGEACYSNPITTYCEEILFSVWSAGLSMRRPQCRCTL